MQRTIEECREQYRVTASEIVKALGLYVTEDDEVRILGLEGGNEFLITVTNVNIEAIDVPVPDGRKALWEEYDNAIHLVKFPAEAAADDDGPDCNDAA